MVSSFGTNHYEDITQTFLALTAGPGNIEDEDIALLERFTILPYNRTIAPLSKLMKNCSPRKVGQWILFLQQKLLLCSTLKEPKWTLLGKDITSMPRHANSGWVDPSNWKPLWITLPEASVSSRELLCCGCKKGCTACRTMQV